MGQAPRRLAAHLSPRHLFGAELRFWRERRRISQDELGRRTLVSGDTVGKVEKAVRWPPPGFPRACDDVLSTGGVLQRIWPLVDAQRGRGRGHADTFNGDADVPALDVAPAPGSERIAFRVDEEGSVCAEAGRAGAGTDTDGFLDVVARTWPRVRLSHQVPDRGCDVRVVLPGGRSLIGAEVAVQVRRARRVGDRVIASIDDPGREREFIPSAGRRLLVAATRADGAPRFYLLDPVRHRAGTGDRDVSVPVGYELDDLTFGILWATTNLDAALQLDDRALVDSRRGLAAYEQLPTSAVSRDAAPDLNPVAQLWLGSDFCARHLLRALPGLPGVPTFWTREQRGEEASTWLLFAHKYAYLRRTVELVGAPTVRALCVPEESVSQSSRAERVLLFLAIALMESLGIHVQLTPEPAYRDVKGFMIADRRQAVIANWIHGDGIWHVDSTSHGGVVADFADAAAYAGSASVIAAPSPARRLRALAGYLGLDWTWLTSRCAALARSGTAGMVRPRSSLISMAGLDTACAFVGSLPGDE